ncbi:MAG: hypothetical protein B0W54_12750 [Cellvibrio sp. 79]|nr:MAG: hypothetical protein B0W54_12750 [Cellvibrio sp. 79]
MIVHSFPFEHEDENSWYNVFIEPLDADGNVMYLIGLTKPGEGIPSNERLKEIALTAETISPFDHSISLPALCILIEDSMRSGTLKTPFLIPEKLIEIKTPSSAFEEGQYDAARGLHYNANPHVEGTPEFDEWDEGWVAGRGGNLEGLRH